jgi:hypothetical protein
MRNIFASNPQLVEITAARNSTLQGAYLTLAARALGLDCGPMSGFDNAKADDEFFGADCATSATVIARSVCPAVRAWNSMRPAPCCESSSMRCR